MLRLWLSDNALYEAFGTRALFQATYGGADFGECAQAVQRVGDGDAVAWHREWSSTTDARVEAGGLSYSDMPCLQF